MNKAEKGTKVKNVFTLIMRICLSCSVLWTTIARAQTPDADDAITKLQTLEENLEVLGEYAERVDNGRLLVIEKQTKNLMDLISKKGLGNFQVLNSYQQLVLSIQYSQAFLTSLRTQGNGESIASIESTTQQIIKDCGFDDQIVSQLVAGILSQIHNINLQVRNQEVPENLANWLQGDLDRAVGNALAHARVNGDVPSTYKVAKVVHDLLRANYNQLFAVGPRSNAYEMITELIGLNEFFQEIYLRGISNSLGGLK